jgi:hypothetical protein
MIGAVSGRTVERGFPQSVVAIREASLNSCHSIGTLREIVLPFWEDMRMSVAMVIAQMASGKFPSS